MLLALRQLTKRAYRVRGIGLGRLCEMLRRAVATHWDGPDVQIQDFMGHLRFSCALTQHMGSQIFWRGHYSGDQLAVLRRLLPSAGVFIDVGANQGEFTVYGASLVGPRGRVIAFEPVSDARERLMLNIGLNGFENVTVVPVALGDRAGSHSIYSDTDSFNDRTSHQDGLATLFPTESRKTELEKVSVRRLDEVVANLGLRRLDLIKLDIEGGELPALKGAEETLRRFRPVLILEVNEDMCRAAGYRSLDLVDWITGLDYRLESIGYLGQTTPFESAGDLPAFQNVVAVPTSG